MSIISATRHEAGNVGPLVQRIGDHLAGCGFTWEIVFVDDSDDDTPQAIADLASAGAPVRMLHRPAGHRSGGLSGALTLGMSRVTSPVIAVIDADLQHPPELLRSLLEPLRTDVADICVASRYVPGGSADGLAGPFRHWVSRTSTEMTRVLFPKIRRVQDPVSGYFALQHDVIAGVDLRPEGFKMLVEILVRGRWDRVVEVPYHFAGRTDGASKVTARLGLQFIQHVGRLWKETRAPR